MTDIKTGRFFTIAELLGETETDAAADEDQRSAGPSLAVKTLRHRHLTHRLFSERAIEETLPCDLHSGDCHHVISGGDVDSLSYLLWILRKQTVPHLLCSTWCISMVDVQELTRQHELGKIGKLDFYAGEILPGSYPEEYAALGELCLKTGGRIAVFRNHSKVMAGIGTNFSFVIESSANINTNPRTENTVITVDHQLAEFYFTFFSGIKSFDRSFEK